jgi:hypothetical protein
MARDRIIRVSDTDVVVGKGRGARQVQLPPFSYSGIPVVGSYSGRWHPYVPLNLLWAQCTSRVSGTAEFEIWTSNIAAFSTTSADARVLATIQLSNNYTLTTFTGTIEQFAVTREQWICIKCIENDTCEDVVISMIGEEMRQEGKEA